MSLPKNPIEFLDTIVTRHKRWLHQRVASGESIRYMREAVDVMNRGLEFLTHYVHNPVPKVPDPAHPQCDLALLQVYEFWRNKLGLRPIEAWDGTRLRPWLPAESNPKVPAVLSGDLRHFDDAYTRWSRRFWAPLDALGNAIESYFEDIRRHHIWSRPKGGGRLRLYRHNELNNIEVAPYSIRFWGFLKWADERRRTLLGEPVPTYAHDDLSDIAFMDAFNQNHFPWHDDVFENGVCPAWDEQFGKKARHRYPMNTYGFGLEFLQFHSDLLAAYNRWLGQVGLPPTTAWRNGDDPWKPGIHHSAHILKQLGWSQWGIGGSNGQPLDSRVYTPELYDPQLSAFDSGSEMGAYFEGRGRLFFGFHGAGHVERCDIRDVYTNNYSLRFFHWHQWIDTAYDKLTNDLGKPKHFWKDTNRTLATQVPLSFFDRFKKRPQEDWPLTGDWLYRSFNADEKWFDESDIHPIVAQWYPAQLTLTQKAENRTVIIGGELRGPHPRPNPKYVYEITGHLDERNVHYELTPDWWEERSIIVMKAEGRTPDTEGHVYHYRGYLVPQWPDGNLQPPIIVGSVFRAPRAETPHKIGSFVAVKRLSATAGLPPIDATTDGLHVDDAVNDRCPVSGKPISSEALLSYNGKVLGFCSTKHRDAVLESLQLLEHGGSEG